MIVVLYITDNSKSGRPQPAGVRGEKEIIEGRGEGREEREREGEREREREKRI